MRRYPTANKRLDYDKIYDLVMQCRKSGLSDRQWCLDNDIVPSTFYYWVRKLQLRACYDLPETECHTRNVSVVAEKQDVVCVNIQPDPIRETAGIQSGSYKWPRSQDEVKSLTWKQFEWLMDGLEIEHPKAIKPTDPSI